MPKITEYNLVSVVSDGDLFIVETSGGTRKMTAAQLKQYVNDTLSTDLSQVKNRVTALENGTGTGSGGGTTSGGSVSVNIIDYDKIIRSINHRGYSEAPENTLPAYKLSASKGFKYVECDVSMTSDGVPMLLHDATIDRTSNGSGTLSEMTYEQVRQYDFGAWKGYTGTLIPTFEEFINLCANLGLHPYIELKSNGSYTSDDFSTIFNIVKNYGMKDNVTWISFNSTYLASIKALHSSARLGLVISAYSSSVIGIINNLKSAENDVFVDINASTLNDECINACMSNEIPLEVWTLDDEDAIKALDPYISGVTSNYTIAGKVLYEAYALPSSSNITIGGSSNTGSGNNSGTNTNTPTGPVSATWTSGYITSTVITTATAPKGEMYSSLVPATSGQKVRLYVSDYSWTTSWAAIGEFATQSSSSNGLVRQVAESVTGTDDNGAYVEFTVSNADTQYVRLCSRNLADYYSMASVVIVGSNSGNTSTGGGGSELTEAQIRAIIETYGYTTNTGTYSKPTTGIPKTDLAESVQTSLGKADSAYQKPSGGIPLSDCAFTIPSGSGESSGGTEKDWGLIGEYTIDSDLSSASYLPFDDGKVYKKLWIIIDESEISGTTYCQLRIGVIISDGVQRVIMSNTTNAFQTNRKWKTLMIEGITGFGYRYEVTSEIQATDYTSSVMSGYHFNTLDAFGNTLDATRFTGLVMFGNVYANTKIKVWGVEA